MLSVLLVQQFHAASLNSSTSGESKTKEGYTFNSVYNLGLSSLQGKEILKRLNTVVQKLDEKQCKGPSRGKKFESSTCTGKTASIRTFFLRSRAQIDGKNYQIRKVNEEASPLARFIAHYIN